MVGKSQLQLGAEQMMSGMSSTDFATDGALGVSTTGINPFVNPGTIWGMANYTDISTNVAGNVIASAEDSQQTTAYVRTFVDNAGNYYTWDGAAVTLRNTATTNVVGYQAGFTDMVSFALNTYVTANGNIDRWNTSTLTLTESWWTSAPQSQPAMTVGIPHPMINYKANLYVADGNLLHAINSSGTIDTFLTAFPFTLNAQEIINALGIDPVTGLMMISVQTTQNYNDTKTSKYFVYLYDGVSSLPARKVPVYDLVTAFHNVEGDVYVGCGQTLGMWNGTGITFLRKFKNVSLLGTDLAYKHHFANIRNILFVVDGKDILTYGAVVSGKKGFFYTANTTTTNHATIVMPLGSNLLGVASATNKLFSWDFSSTATVAGANAHLFFNNIYFPRPVFIRRVRVITTGITTNGGAGTFQITSEKGVAFATSNPFFTVLAANSPQYVFDFDFSSLKLQGMQIDCKMDTVPWGFVRFIVYYDISE